MMTSGAANIGVVGLAVMGSNLARNLASREGNRVAVHNRTYARTESLLAEHPDAGFIAGKSIDEFAASLARPRTAIIMVQAGAGTDAVIDQLAERCEPGDIIVDGGNANFQDTIAREKRNAPTGIHFVGVGISGGEEVRSGARRSCRAARRSPAGPSAPSSLRSPRSRRTNPASRTWAPTAPGTSSR